MTTKKLNQWEKEHTREVKLLGKTIRVRKISPTKEALVALGMRSKRIIVSHMPVEPKHIEEKIKKERAKILREMTMMHPKERAQFIAAGPIDFIKDKDDRQKYKILCSNCGDEVATVWAKNASLNDWVDLHYICWYDKESWHGAMAINVSPVDGHLGIECACGEDTREFRVNRTMPPIQRRLLSEYSLKHRGFGTPESKFAAVAA